MEQMYPAKITFTRWVYPAHSAPFLPITALTLGWEATVNANLTGYKRPRINL